MARAAARRVIFTLALVVCVVALGVAARRYLATRGEPPSDLSAREAVDLACFHGWGVGGAPAYVPAPRQLFVANLSHREVLDFLRQQHVGAALADDGLVGFLDRSYVVVARGTVTAEPDPGSDARGQGLILVIDLDGSLRYAAIGPPWDTVVPPGAQPFDVPNQPILSDVSRSRARIELAGAPLVGLAGPPGGLSLRRITINDKGLPVDPSGSSYPGRSVTLYYADSTGRPRLWLSQSAPGAGPRVAGRL